MTALRINYDTLQETKRANAAREEETHRSNVENEIETNRSNLAREAETNRANVARETETHRSNLVNEAETHRSNVAREAETNRSNLAREAETNRHNVVSEGETNRSNVANEALKERGQTIDALKTTKGEVGIKVGGKGIGGSAMVSGSLAAKYANDTDSTLKAQRRAEAKMKADKQAAANAARVLGPEGIALIGTTYNSQDDVIKAITSIPSEQRLNLKIVDGGKGKYKLVQNPSIDPKTGKIKNKK